MNIMGRDEYERAAKTVQEFRKFHGVSELTESIVNHIADCFVEFFIQSNPETFDSDSFYKDCGLNALCLMHVLRHNHKLKSAKKKIIRQSHDMIENHEETWSESHK